MSTETAAGLAQLLITSIVLTLMLMLTSERVEALTFTSHTSLPLSPLYQQKNIYGRGAEIWPEPPKDEVIVLADSFPNGEIPFVAIASIGEADIMETIHQQVVDGNKRSRNSSSSSHKQLLQQDITSEGRRGRQQGDWPSSPSMSISSKQQQRAKRVRKRDSLKRILRRAAAKEELDAEVSSSLGDINDNDRNGPLWGDPSSWPTSIPILFRLLGQGWVGLRRLERTPALIVSVILLVMGYVRPLDIAAVATITTYIIVLLMASQSYRDSSYVPHLPSCPPQGHVPAMVTNPLGREFSTNTSGYYYAWLRLGAILGCIIPTLWTMTVILLGLIPSSIVTTLTSSSLSSSWMPVDIINSLITGLGDNAASMSLSLSSSPVRLGARHLFILCCQIMTEATTKRRVTTTPLPIRILVPCLYNTVRLSYLWSWARSSFDASSTASLVLAGLSLVYWSINLLGFLLPVAVMRYMRSHFFCVEAEEVKLRQGLEETAGLVPNYNSGGRESLSPY